MSKLRLVFPTLDDKEKVLSYKNTFIENQELIHGSAGLAIHSNYEDWFLAVIDNSKEETVQCGLVPSSTYLAIDDSGNLVGMIDIRHRLNEYLINLGGHIGYSILKSERKKGYATEMLRQALDICRNLKIEKALITCDKDNIASAKTILKNGGILEDERKENSSIIQRYWINLN